MRDLMNGRVALWFGSYNIGWLNTDKSKRIVELRKKVLGIFVDHQVQVLALCEQQQLQQQVQRGHSAAVLIRLTLGTCRVRKTCTSIGHLPGSPDLHGTRGNVRRTGLGRPEAVAAAVPQREVRGGLRRLLPLCDGHSATMK